MRLWFSQKNIYGHTAGVVQILQLQLTVQIHKLKYKLQLSEHKSLEYKSTL